jgi:hypothetical protein
MSEEKNVSELKAKPVTKNYSITKHNKNRLMVSFTAEDTGFNSNQIVKIDIVEHGKKIIITDKELWDSENE